MVMLKTARYDQKITIQDCVDLVCQGYNKMYGYRLIINIIS